MSENTSLSNMLNRVDSWQALTQLEETFKVDFLDQAIRDLRQTIQLPWTIKQSTLRVFSNVLFYPVASDHDELAYLDDSRDQGIYALRARFKNTSMKQFMENTASDRNDLAEIWDDGNKMLGVRYSKAGNTDSLLNNAGTLSQWSVSGDAGTPVLETVVVKVGTNSIKVPITSSSGTASIKNTFTTAFTDANYKKKYHFVWRYLASAPTSIAIRFQVSDSVYLETTGITTQFSGQALKAGAWNLLAHNLDEATEVGTITTASLWASEKTIYTGAATGTYYFDDSNLREWSLMDYWYYSKFMVQTLSASLPDQETFKDADGVYSTDSVLVGDKEWESVIRYEAMVNIAADTENSKIQSRLNTKRNEAWDAIFDKYPTLVPLITTSRYRMATEFNRTSSPIFFNNNR